MTLRRANFQNKIWNPQGKAYVECPIVPVAFHQFAVVRNEDGYDEVVAIIEDFDGKVQSVPIEWITFTDLPDLAPLEDLEPIYVPLEVESHLPGEGPLAETEEAE
jgi:hypothetical protein